MMIQARIKKILQYEKTIFILLPLLFFILYFSSIDVKYSVAADATAKWQQSRDIITKPLFDFSCSYKYDIDPTFEYIPGARYFYYLEKEKCFHMYSYVFAYLYAPFLYFFADYGIYVLNYLSWLIYIFSFASLAKLAINKNDKSYFYGGLIAIFVSPTVIYAIGFTEVTISFALGIYSLFLIYSSLKELESKKNNFIKLLFAGLMLGYIFFIRSESIIYTTSLYFSTLLYCISKKNNFKNIINFFIPLMIGLVFGLVSLGIFHQVLFQSITGYRGSFAMQLMKDSFSIKNQLQIAYLQLFAGPRGLFTSMPITLFSFAYFHPKIKNKFKEDGLYFILIGLITTILIVSTSPWGDFADWTPRYLSLAFAPFLISMMQVCFSDESEFLKKKILKIIFICLIIYSILFNLIGIIIVAKIINTVKIINVEIEKFNADSIILDTLIPYIYISNHNTDKPIFSLRLTEKDSENFSKTKLNTLVKLLDDKKQDRKILIIQVEGVSNFLFKGDEVNGWNQKESYTLMKKVKFLLIERK